MGLDVIFDGEEVAVLMLYTGVKEGCLRRGAREGFIRIFC